MPTGVLPVANPNTQLRPSAARCRIRSAICPATAKFACVECGNTRTGIRSRWARGSDIFRGEDPAGCGSDDDSGSIRVLIEKAQSPVAKKTKAQPRQVEP